MLSILQITTELCKERMVNALREKVGFRKKWSVEAFSELGGMDERSVESYLGGYALPTLPKFLRMCKILGPGFANRFLRIAGLDGCSRVAVQSVTDHELNGEVARMIGTIGCALTDGRIDHKERAEILAAARHLLPLLQDWVAENDRIPGDPGAVSDESFLTLRNDVGGFDA